MREPGRRPFGGCTLAAAVLTSAALGAPPAAAPGDLCAPGTTIGRIVIERVNVFDPAVAGEDRAVFRLVNALHSPMQTREGTLRTLLALHEGDACELARLEEAERELRQESFVQDAWVEPVSRQGDRVTVRVRVRDAWSTSVRIGLSSQGGASRTAYRIEEENLLGWGVKLGWERTEDQDRTQKALRLHAPVLFGHRARLQLVSADLSDGRERSCELARPFWNLNARRSWLASWGDVDREEKVYVGPDPIDYYQLRGRSAGFEFGVSPSGLRDGQLLRWRLGLQREERRWRLNAPAGEAPHRPDLRPVDRDQLLAAVRLEWRRIDFRRVQFVNRAVRVEDLDVGTLVSAGLEVAVPGITEDSGGALSLAVRRGFGVSERTFLSVAAAHQIRRARGLWFNGSTQVEWLSYHRLAPLQTLHVRFLAARGARLEGVERFLLGGDTGLRGYRSRAFTGDRLLLLNVEHRFFAPWEWLHLVRVGMVAFLEVGGAWDGPLRLAVLHPDVGAGLRLAVLRTSAGTTLHFNVAWPLDPNADPGRQGLRFSFVTLTSF